ncbi:nucleic acid-binding protein [Corynespora cassiicola Philippines]|uniref:Nucleic acid-binding protein n=1 Tax=Corynespora cassiicola Philippines TaxID=1448308 RepID=A0A2T2NGI9_CORCC|nr:nucleic acid-binding protein [Corynespora cassiicola Philippines]
MSRAAVPIVRQMISSQKVGVVVSAGKMSKAVKVRIAGQEWHKKFRKHFPSETTYLVADPNNSLVEGDVVRIASGWRTSKSIRHVVTSIVAPFGKPVEERPPVPTEEERMENKIKERLLKDVRSAAKGRIASKDRLKEARRQGYELPTLEEAMKNVKVQDQVEGELRSSDAAEAHKGQSGQIASNKARRVQKGIKTKEEQQTENEVKEARVQSA